MIHIKTKEVEYLQFRKLLEFSDKIQHCYTLKPLDFNIGEIDKVRKDYNEICDALRLDDKKIYRPSQTHNINIKKVLDEEPGIYGKEFQDTDGLITNQKNKILSLTFADCICLYFYDPIKNVIGNIHSGWKGTYEMIAKEAVKKLKEEYKVDLKSLICAISPSIRNCCFEVTEDVKDMFYERFKNFKEIEDIIKKSENNGKYYIDTVLINKIILRKEGLSIKNIIDSGICTKCNWDKMHSYREEKEIAGRNTGLIALI